MPLASKVKQVFAKHASDGVLEAEDLPDALRDAGTTVDRAEANQIITAYDTALDPINLNEFTLLLLDFESGALGGPREEAPTHSKVGANLSCEDMETGIVRTNSRDKGAVHCDAIQRPKLRVGHAWPKGKSHAAKVIYPMRLHRICGGKSAKPSLLQKELYDPLPGLGRFVAVAQERLNNMTEELRKAEDAFMQSKVTWKERRLAAQVECEARRFAAPGRARLVKLAEEKYWRARAEVDTAKEQTRRAQRVLASAKNRALNQFSDAPKDEEDDNAVDVA